MKVFLVLSVFVTFHTTLQSVIHPQLISGQLNRNSTTNEENILDIVNLEEGNILLDIFGSSDLLQQALGNSTYSNVDLDLLNQWMSLFDRLQNIQYTLQNNECSKQLQMYLNSLVKMDDWAVRMFDATAKLQSGILEGNTMQVGNYDECLKIGVFVNGTQINGQYCTGVLTDTEENKIDPYDRNSIADFKLSFGFCVPAVCDNVSLVEVARQLEATFDSPFHFQFPEELCDSSIKPRILSTWVILCIAFFSAVATVIVLSTLYDIFLFRKTKGNETSLYIAFSFYTNGRKLFSTKTSTEALNCLNGMRVISMAWIIVAHRYMYSFSLPMINLLSALKWEQDYESTLITAATLAVDTFFMISGLLIVYVFLNHKAKGQNVSIIMFYVHRILRLSPALVALVLFYGTIFSFIGSGPFWVVIYLYFQHACETSWWSTLLYVQNYMSPIELCVSQSWYLAVDTQLYILSPLLLFPLIKWPKRTITAIILLIIMCCSIVFSITWIDQLGPAFYGLDNELLTRLYNPTHTRAAPWLVGIIMGYIMFQCKNKIVKIHKVAVLLLWVLSIGTMLAIVLYHSRIGHAAGTAEVSRLKASLFNSLARTMWTIGVSVIAFLCVTGYGGIINKFLSASIFTVLIRVNYSMYLLHMGVILYDIAQKRAPEYVSPNNMFYLFWGDLAITFILSVLWTLAFESPILVLEKLLFGKKKKPSSNGTASKLKDNNNIDAVVVHNSVIIHNSGKEL